MDTLALRYFIRLAKGLLARSPVGLLMFQNVGEPRHSSVAAVLERLRAHGFQPLPSASGYVLSAAAASVIAAGRFAVEPPPVGGPTTDLRPASDFVDANQHDRLESYAFFDFLRLDLG